MLFSPIDAQLIFNKILNNKALLPKNARLLPLRCIPEKDHVLCIDHMLKVIIFTRMTPEQKDLFAKSAYI